MSATKHGMIHQMPHDITFPSPRSVSLDTNQRLHDHKVNINVKRRSAMEKKPGRVLGTKRDSPCPVRF